MEFLNSIFSFAPGSVQGWDASKHPRDFEGRFQRGEAWDESEHQRDAQGRFTYGSPNITGFDLTESNREIEDTSRRLTNYYKHPGSGPSSGPFFMPS